MFARYTVVTCPHDRTDRRDRSIFAALYPENICEDPSQN
jgi:hypothetical protein